MFLHPTRPTIAVRTRKLYNTLVYPSVYPTPIGLENRHKMKVACLQFAPEVGKLQENIARADSILLQAQLPFDIDWLVLPELAFTGKQTQRVSGTNI